MSMASMLAIVGFDNETHIGIWVGVFLTISIFSFLYRDNVLYKLAEHVMVGIATGYLAIYSYYFVLKRSFVDPVIFGVRAPGDEEWEIYLRIVPFILGLFMLARLIPRLGWLSRWTMALSIGIAAGVALPLTLQTRVLEQVLSGVQDVPIFPAPGTPWHMVLGTWVLLVGTIGSLIYFFFSKAHTGIFGGFARMGIWVLMIGFGASFGYTVMARLSLLIGRVIFLLQDWLEVVRITT
jgi:hypothetical protein